MTEPKTPARHDEFVGSSYINLVSTVQLGIAGCTIQGSSRLFTSLGTTGISSGSRLVRRRQRDVWLWTELGPLGDRRAWREMGCWWMSTWQGSQRIL